MYEYIPNRIIEGTIKTIITTVKYVFFIVNDFYFYNEDDDDDADNDNHDEEELERVLLGFDTEPEEYSWEYDIKEVLYKFCYEVFTYLLPDKNNNKNIKNSESSASASPKNNPVDYVDKYKEEWKNRLSSKEVKRKEEIDVDYLKKNVLIENTPFGNVIMYYDSVKDTFVYYSDKTLSYPIVNTVGRKYVLTFGCESLYVDETNQETNNKDTIDSSSSSSSQTNVSTTEQKKNVYAKFKNYKKPNSTQYSASVKKEETKEEIINRYTCEGKLANFSFLQKVPKVKPFSYKDFKNKFKST
jgi:hypothetical protein